MTDLTFIGSMQHKEHREWLSQLNFYQDQIKIFQTELAQVLHRHPKYLSILEHVNEYRRILLKKLQHIDEFRHQIILHEKRISQNLEPDTEGLWDHSEMRIEVQKFMQDFEELKQNFRRFVVHNN